MSDDYRDCDEEYWTNVYNYEMYEKELDESGCSSGGILSGSFLAWFIALVIASNISKDLGSVIIFVGLAFLIIKCLRR